MVNILIDILLILGIVSASIFLLAGLFYGLALIAIWMDGK